MNDVGGEGTVGDGVYALVELFSEFGGPVAVLGSVYLASEVGEMLCGEPVINPWSAA